MDLSFLYKKKTTTKAIDSKRTMIIQITENNVKDISVIYIYNLTKIHKKRTPRLLFRGV